MSPNLVWRSAFVTKTSLPAGPWLVWNSDRLDDNARNTASSVSVRANSHRLVNRWRETRTSRLDEPGNQITGFLSGVLASESSVMSSTSRHVVELASAPTRYRRVQTAHDRQPLDRIWVRRRHHRHTRAERILPPQSIKTNRGWGVPVSGEQPNAQLGTRWLRSPDAYRNHRSRRGHLDTRRSQRQPHGVRLDADHRESRP